jgi:hypothetical protein
LYPNFNILGNVESFLDSRYKGVQINILARLHHPSDALRFCRLTRSRLAMDGHAVLGISELIR